MRHHVIEGPLPLTLGPRTYDLASRALVMGILNRTRDSFYPPAATYELDDFLARAEGLVEAGADLLDVGGVKAGPGEEVTEAEELERVVPAVEALVARFALPVSVDTWRAGVAEAAFSAGAWLGNDISGFADPRYLEVAATAGASVVATHIRLAPRVPDPDPHYDDVTASVAAFLVERRARALAAGISAERIILDAGLDLGKTTAHSLALLRDSPALAALGSPLLLSASNKTFLGDLFDLAVTERREASAAAVAVGVLGGCRILRVHDVAGTVRVRDALAALAGAAR
ncbi:MAG TPA: dihydropteroate synthase [Acidimicrobiales bacterium]|nr:MAG: dihydropteroate synthase [Actinobacteria bacterium 21-73-9]HQU25607.1 dihydropteroate synthase [Acidimicrobiales bacterium]